MKTKYRVIQNSYSGYRIYPGTYRVQLKKWYWFFWKEDTRSTIFLTIDDAVNYVKSAKKNQPLKIIYSD